MINRMPWNSARDESHPPWPLIVAISVLLHGFVLLGIWGMERYSPRRSLITSFISVSLVNPPTGSTATKGPTSSEKPEETKIKKKIRRPVPRTERKTVSIRPPELKLPERKKVSPETQPTSKPPESPPTSRKVTQPAAAVTATPAARGGSGQLNAEEARYLELLRKRIVENWRAYVFPEEGVLGEVRILISSDGRIRDFTFVRGSGKAHVDASIVRALKKVVLPPPPSSLAERPLLLRFWPFGPEA